MVGKIATRPRLHLAAPKLPPGQTGGFGQEAEGGGVAWRAPPLKNQAFLPSKIFAGVTIDPKALVKKLDEEPRSVASVIKDEEKIPLSKKEKMKLRKERWLQKIEDFKLARKREKEEAKRKATPVVGDMNPLMEALPELSDLVTVSKFCKPSKTQAKKAVTNFSRMKSAQKRKLLEEDMARFQKMLSNPLFKANPLAVIGEHLSKRLKQEKEGGPL